MPRTIDQLINYTEMATDRQYLLALTESGRIFYVRRELLAGGGPLEWIEIESIFPSSTPPPVPLFVSIEWISTGNYLLGLKDDGTVWKCAAPGAASLVWVQVS